jgi:hypothetical protein
MTLFYNSLYSLIYVVLMGAVVIDKLTYYSQTFPIAILVLWAILEPVRLYYGLYGNLNESVAHISTFLLMTIFPQLALVLYLAYFQQLKYPMDSILGSFMFIFAVFELVMSWNLIRKVIRSQTAQFMRLVDHDE